MLFIAASILRQSPAELQHGDDNCRLTGASAQNATQGSISAMAMFQQLSTTELLSPLNANCFTLTRTGNRGTIATIFWGQKGNSGSSLRPGAASLPSWARRQLRIHSVSEESFHATNSIEPNADCLLRGCVRRHLPDCRGRDPLRQSGRFPYLFLEHPSRCQSRIGQRSHQG